MERFCWSDSVSVLYVKPLLGRVLRERLLNWTDATFTRRAQHACSVRQVV